MKIYISADIEGVAGVVSGEETRKGKEGYAENAQQMTAEVNSAVKGAFKAGAEEILIKDAHGGGENIKFSELEEKVRLIRGWSNHPLRMIQELDSTFDVVIMIGYHAYAGSSANPLAHTINGRIINNLKINEEEASEFLINSYAAAMKGVPVVMLSGDQGVCNQAQNKIEDIETVAVKEGKGKSVISMHPNKAQKIIENKVEYVLNKENRNCHLSLPEEFEVYIEYPSRYHSKAHRASFYPGAEKVSSTTVKYENDDFLEVLTFFNFVVY